MNKIVTVVYNKFHKICINNVMYVKINTIYNAQNIVDNIINLNFTVIIMILDNINLLNRYHYKLIILIVNGQILIYFIYLKLMIMFCIFTLFMIYLIFSTNKLLNSK